MIEEKFRRFEVGFGFFNEFGRSGKRRMFSSDRGRGRKGRHRSLCEKKREAPLRFFRAGREKRNRRGVDAEKAFPEAVVGGGKREQIEHGGEQIHLACRGVDDGGLQISSSGKNQKGNVDIFLIEVGCGFKRPFSPPKLCPWSPKTKKIVFLKSGSCLRREKRAPRA